MLGLSLEVRKRAILDKVEGTLRLLARKAMGVRHRRQMVRRKEGHFSMGKMQGISRVHDVQRSMARQVVEQSLELSRVLDTWCSKVRQITA